MVSGIEAHGQMLCQNDIVIWVLVAILAVEQMDAAPARGAVFFTGSSVFAAGVIEPDGTAVEKQGDEHVFGSLIRPANVEGLLQGGGEGLHKFKEIHALPVDAGRESGEPEDNERADDPNAGLASERLVLADKQSPPEAGNASHGETHSLL